MSKYKIYKNILSDTKLDFKLLAHPITIVSIPIYYFAKFFNIHNKTYENNMGGFDKSLKGRELEGLGWTETVTGNYIPPDSLFKNSPQSFHVYDAEAIQNLLGEHTQELKDALGE